jgi:hypothetical protein
MSADTRHPGLREWDRAWSHVATLPSPLARLVHDALAEMIKVLAEEAADHGEDVQAFDLLLFAKGAERFCRSLLAETSPGVDPGRLSAPGSSPTP